MPRAPSLALAFAPALVALGLAPPVQALDLEAMSEAERDAFRAEVRAYLLENPEVLMEAIGVLEAREEAAQAAGDVALVQANLASLLEDGHSWVGGNPQGDITIVEFLDYRCGFCKRAFPEVEALLAEDGNIRIIVKEFPILGEASVLASRFAIATLRVAGDAAYKDVHDTMMTMRGDITPEALARLGDELGLDTAAILAEMESDAVTEVIAANHALADRLRITGTPTFVVGEQMLRGFLPRADMQRIVEAERDG